MTDHQDARSSDTERVSISRPQEIAVTVDQAPAETTLIPSKPSEKEEALLIRNNIDKLRILRALAFTLLPFAAVCAIGTWLALHQKIEVTSSKRQTNSD